MANAALEKKLSEITAPVQDRLRLVFAEKKEPFEVYGLLGEFLSINGKLLRPAFCLSACSAVGGKPEDAVRAATTIEMFHNFTLIHDDIEDCSQKRRGKPCMHVKYGVPLALNAGGGLFMMTWREALSISGKRRELVQQKLLTAFTEVLEGQAAELGWYHAGKWDVEEADYFRVVGGKTGALIAASCEVGGILGGGNDTECAALAEFGRKIGMGFQIVDDVLNIIGDEKKYGKEIGGDVMEGKRTLITIRALRSLGKADGAKLERLLKKQGKTDEDVKEAVGLLKRSGAAESAMKTANDMVDGAIARLYTLPESPARQTLAELADYVAQRQK